MRYDEVLTDLRARPRKWLVTGAAGFIGSSLVETLLGAGQLVVGLDNFATGRRETLESLRNGAGSAAWRGFSFIEGDIRNEADCRAAVAGCDVVLHQAGLGSVPRSIDDPVTTNAVNIGGFLNMMVAARDEGVADFVYAASSSTYGDHPALPKVENAIGAPLSPYALTKYVNELYADVFARTYGFRSIGLRYFNVFGPRQDPAGPYAAVIPRWLRAMCDDEDVWINGDGSTSRDFTFIANAVQANILAASADDSAKGEVYNVAYGTGTTLCQLFQALVASLARQGVRYARPARLRDFRSGDVRHSLADIGKARRLLGYVPTVDFAAGIAQTVKWRLEEPLVRASA
jgi:UDP-N-acetylglucosamine 4-epimerase